MASSARIAIYVAVSSTLIVLAATVLVAFIMIFCNSSFISQINAELQELRNSTHSQQPCNTRHISYITYIRWGHNECPPTPGTTKVYEGFAAGTYDTNNTSTSCNLCLPVSQGHNHYSHTASQYGGMEMYTVHGMVYNTFVPKRKNRGVACTLCKVSTRNTVVMIPATDQCSMLMDSSGDSWTKEYDGYLMQASGAGSDYYCVDYDMRHFHNSQQNFATLSHVAAGKDGPQVSSHNPQKVLSCVVCTIWK